MIGFLIPIAARIGIPTRLQRTAAWVMAAAVLALLATAAIVWFRATIRHERAEAVKADQDAFNANVLQQDRNASDIADAALENTQAADRQNEKELQREIDAAAPSNGAVGNITVSVLERLRQQQSAGRR